MKKIKYLSIGLFTLTLLVSCSKDSLEPTQYNSIDPASLKTYDDIRLVADGMYKLMRSTAYYGRDYIIFDEVRSDNTFSSGNSGRFVTPGAMNMTDNDAYAGDTFSDIYTPIASANIVINSNVTGDTDAIMHTKGEAYAVRALCHFDLLKLFGQQYVDGQGGLNSLGIAYITEYKGTNVFPTRNTVAEVKTKIYADIDAAIANLMPSLNDPDNIRITSYAAHALKSRIALYFKDWQIAKDEAQIVIDSNYYTMATAANYVSSFTVSSAVNNKVFTLKSLSNDNNSIDGLANIYRGNTYGDINVLQDLRDVFGGFGTGTLAGGVFTDVTHSSGNFAVGQTITGTGIPANTTITGLLTGTGANSGGTYTVSTVVNVSSTAVTGLSSDVRGSTAMIKVVSGKLRNVGKYPTPSPYNDNPIIMRYEEVVLNYAEALFRMNASDPAALTALNSIVTNRAPVASPIPPYTSVTEDNILLERRKELCFEGFRFTDLARTGRNIPLVSPIQQTHGGVTYGSFRYAFPIPVKELNANFNTIQNIGY